MPLGEPGFEWSLDRDEPWDPRYIKRYSGNPNLHLIAVSALYRLDDEGGPVFKGLTPGQRMLLSTAAVENHVNQGGFCKLWICAGWAIEPAIEGYRLIGADRVAERLERARAAADWSRWQSDALSDEQEERFLELDSEALEGGYDLGNLKNEYLQSHTEEFPFVG